MTRQCGGIFINPCGMEFDPVSALISGTEADMTSTASPSFLRCNCYAEPVGIQQLSEATAVWNMAD